MIYMNEHEQNELESRLMTLIRARGSWHRADLVRHAMGLGPAQHLEALPGHALLDQLIDQEKLAVWVNPLYGTKGPMAVGLPEWNPHLDATKPAQEAETP